MDRAQLLRNARIAGRLYVVYFVIAVAGMALGSVALSVIGTAAYFVLALQLFRVVSPFDRRVAAVYLAMTGVGCVVQGVGMARADRQLQVLALVFFALGLFALGYVAVRSGFIPRAIGVLLLGAGAAWCAVVLIPGLPVALAAGAMAFGGLAELALALWLLFGTDVSAARPSPDRALAHK